MSANLFRIEVFALVDVNAVGSMVASRTSASIVIEGSRCWMTCGIIMTRARHTGTVSIDALSNRHFKFAKLPVEALWADAVVAAVRQA